MTDTRFKVIAAAAVAAAALLKPDAARADATTFLTGTNIVFSSPNNVYGPWTIETLRSSNKIQNGAVDLELSTRTDSDRPNPTSGILFGVGYTHDLSPWLYYNAVVKLASAGISPFPTSDVHGELGFKVSADRRLVLNVADDYATFTHSITSNEVLAGPTYYGTGFVLQARVTETANTGNPTRAGALAAIDVYTSRRQSKVTVAAQFGPASYDSFIPGFQIASGDYTGSAVTLSTLQWFNSRVGLTAGIQYMHLTNVRTGGLLYNGRGATIGLAVR
jgi:YaiO family outer membrane protein